VTTRDRTILMVVGAFVAIAGFWFMALKPKRTDAQAITAKIVTERQRLETAQQTVAAGEQAKAGYAGDYSTVAELGKAIPADDDLPTLLYQLEATARGAHVSFRSLTRSAGAGGATATPAAGAAASSGASGASTPGSSSAGASSPGAASSSTGAASTATSGSTATAGAAPAATAASVLPPGAVVGAAGLATLPFSFNFTGSYAELERLLSDVQGFVHANGDKIAVRGRLLTIDGVSLVPGSSGLSNLQAKLAVTAYLAPQTATPSAASGSATGAGGAATTPAAPTSSAISGGGTS
jgi:Tfp pilus assembly protein PilO